MALGGIMMWFFSKRKKKKRKNRSFIRLGIVCIIVFLFVATIPYVMNKWPEFLKNPEGMIYKDLEHKAIEVVIPEGASTQEIATILRDKGVIRHPLLFRVISKILGVEDKYKHGLFLLGSSMTYEDIMSELQKGAGRNGTVRFTIPEGYELRQIVQRLSEQHLIDADKFMEEVNNGQFNYKFLKDVPKSENRLEGYLFPDTYEVYKDATEREIITKMLDRFNEIFNEQYYQRAKELNMSIDEVVTLASIIEREAKLDEERPLVSAVFHNRLNSREYPFLQSCATVQYILKERKPVLSVADTKIESPYNTYLHPGLPIGPIASPGKASIHAALYPEDVDYLFFVANSDGSHIYSRTYEEHLEAMKRVK